jgi:tetratricopeptide (TPR) repeat protein
MRNSKFIAGLFMVLGAHCGMASAPTCRGPESLEQEVRDHAKASSWSALGAWFGERRQFACAISSFEAAVRLEPQSARFRYFLGITYYSAGNSELAITELDHAVKLDPKDARLMLALGAALNKGGKGVEAESVWQQALLLNPSSVTGLDWLAKSRMAHQDNAGAIDLLQSAPDDEDLTLDLAFAYSGAGDLDKAVSTLSQATARHESLRLASALATVLARVHRYEEAITTLQPAVAAHLDDTPTGLLYLRLLVLKGDYQAATPLAQRLLAANPNSFDALYLSGLVEREDLEYAAASQHLRAAVALNPQHYDARYNLGLVLARTQQPQPALQQFQLAVKLDPSQAETYFQLAQVLRALGRPDESQAQLKIYQQKMLAAARRDLSISRSSEAAQALKKGDAQKAAELYREAITADPENAMLQCNLALALDHTGDLPGERTALEKALALDPRIPEAENQLGILAAKSGELAAAEEHFRRALTITPHFAEASINLGALLGQQDKDREAEQQFRAALASNPRSVQGWTNLAATLASEARYTEARESAQSAIRIDPSDEAALQLLRMLPAAQPATVPAPR